MTGLTIHQIWYRDEQRPFLEPRMKPWDNRENLRPEWCEYWVMRSAWLDDDRQFDERTGFFSWKYRQKLDLDYGQIEGFITAHSGADCCIFSPAVFQVAFYRNVWSQAEVWHPGMTKIAQAMLDDLGIRVDLAGSVDHHLSTAYANLWVGSRPFWRAYMEFMERIFEYIEAQRERERSPFWQNRFGSSGGDGHVQCLPIIPYLVERMFSVFVKMHPEFRIAAWEYPLDILKKRAFRAAGMIPLANWCKLMYHQTGSELYLNMFAQMQNEMYTAATKSLEENPGSVIS
ncbi:MAG: hypothetical protein BWY66_00223 [bacterium ADurb.Bin374]|nr:MAG: hypothetical protein BWY66_00223 [bacterium ADurb.Bin374]